MENSIAPQGAGQPNDDFHYQVTHFLETHNIIYQFLRFACIGFLNTGLSFLVVNTISKFFNISQGIPYGLIVGIGFICAVVQSYPWNKTWTFGGESGVSLWTNVVRLFSVGALGFAALLFVLLASGHSAPAWSYLIFLAAYLITEDVLWRHFGFHLSDWDHEGHSFLIFFIVTAVGFFINSGLSALLSVHIHLTHTDLDKNIATALATGVSFIWNFSAYKIVVFKK
jgi:putative flippase GtrA